MCIPENLEKSDRVLCAEQTFAKSPLHHVTHLLEGSYDFMKPGTNPPYTLQCL